MNKIKELIDAKNWSYEQLATAVYDVTGIETSRQQMMRLAKGERRLSDVWLDRLAPALGVTRSVILGDDPQSTTLPMLGTVTSGEALKPSKVSKSVTPPDTLPVPGHLEVYLMGDNSMNLASMAKGAILFVRPVWHVDNDYPGNIYDGHGSYYLYKSRVNGVISLFVRQHHADPGKSAFAMACSSDQSFLPVTLEPEAECDSESGEPPAGIDDTPCIYGIVEAAQTDYTGLR